MPVIPALGQKDLEYKDSQSYTMSIRSHSDTWLKKKKENRKRKKLKVFFGVVLRFKLPLGPYPQSPKLNNMQNAYE
jgi:hypothetical protein